MLLYLHPLRLLVQKCANLDKNLRIIIGLLQIALERNIFVVFLPKMSCDIQNVMSALWNAKLSHVICFIHTQHWRAHLRRKSTSEKHIEVLNF